MTVESILTDGATAEVAALIATLHKTGQRIEELTAGEVDAVAGHDGKAFLLRGAQEQLRQIESARQAAILNALPAHIALLDPRGVIISVNEAWQGFVRANAIQDPGYAIGVNYLDACDAARGEDAPEAHDVAAGIRAILNGETKRFALEYPGHLPAEKRRFQLTVIPLSEGRPNGAVIMHLDVTVARQIEERLRESESRFRQMAENIRDVFFLISADDQRMLYVSPAYEAIWERSCASLYADPQSWNDAIHPEDRTRVDQTLAAGAVTGHFDHEYRILRPDGAQRWVRVRGYPIRDDMGSLQRIAGLAVDITASKYAAQELLESERRFSDLLQNVELVSVMIDSEARITYCNEYFLRLTGWQQDDVIGRDWFEVFIPPEAGEMKAVFAALLADVSSASHNENEILTRSGERRLIRWNNSVLRSGVGEVTGTASIGEDITEQKRAEIRIKRLNRVYAVLSGINTLIVRATDRAGLFTEACRIAVEHGKFQMAWVGILDRCKMNLVPVASTGVNDETLNAIKERFSLSLTGDASLKTSLAAAAIKNKEIVISNDTQSDPRVVFSRTFNEAGVRSMALLPLIVDGDAVGILALYSGEAGFFDHEELTLLAELAGDISFAIAHIAKEEKFARLSRIQAVMSGINAAIVHVKGRQELFDEACRIAVEDGKLGLAWIGALDPPTQDVTPVAWAGESAEELTRTKSSARTDTPQGQGAVARAIHERTPIFNNDIVNHPFGGPRLKQIVTLGFKSQITLPLFEGVPVVGTLTMYAMEPDFFVEEEVALLTELAENISFALDHIGKAEKIARLSRIQALMSGINSAIVHIVDRQSLFNEACRIAVELGGFGLAWIGKLDPASMEVSPLACAGVESEFLLQYKSTARSDSLLGEGELGRAIREKSAVYSNDLTASADVGGERRREAIRRGYRSSIVLPLLVAGTAVGSLTLFAKEPDFFNADELKLLNEIAGDIAFAIENIERQEKLEKLSRIRAVSREIAVAIVHIPEHDALLREVCRIAVEHGRFELVWIAALDAAKQEVRPVAWEGFSTETAGAVSWSSITAAAGTLGEAISTRQPATRSDIEGVKKSSGLRHEALEKGCRSTISLPLLVAGKAAAIVVLFAPGVGFFDNEEIALLSEVAANVSFALEHFEKEDKIARLSRIQALMSGINSAIVRVRDRQELFNEACRIAVESGGFGIAWIGKFDPAAEEITPVAWAGIEANETNARRCTRVDSPAGQGLAARAVRGKTAVFENDLTDKPYIGGGGRKEAIRRGYRSLIALPLLAGDAVLGTLSLFASEPDFFDAEEITLLTELAGNISFAIENIERQEKLEKLSRIRAVSGEINVAIVHALNRDALLLEVCRIAVEHGKFRFVWIAAVDEIKQQIRTVAWNGFSPESAHKIDWASICAVGGTLAEAIRTRQPSMRSDANVETRTRGLRYEAAQQGYLSMVCLPLMAADQLAALIVLYAQGAGFFDNEEVALLNEVAANVSFALGNFEKEEKIARLSRIQALMSGINSAIVRARDRVELFNEACRIAVDEGKFGTAWIGTFDSQDKQVTPVAWAGRAGESLACARAVSSIDVVSGSGVVSRAIREKQAVFDNDIASGVVVQTRRRAEAIRKGFNSLVVVPFVIADTVVGHLSLYASEAVFFNEGELKLLNEVACNISFALENIERQKKLEKLSRIRAVSGQINAAIVRVTTHDALLKEVCRIAVESGKFELVWIAALDRKTDKVRPVVWAGFPSKVAHAVDWKAISGAKGVIAESIRTTKLSVRNDIVAQASSGVLREDAIKRGFFSTVSLPLVVDEIVEAVIILYAHGTNFFDQDELVLLSEVASDISLALQSIARREQLDKLSRIRAVSSEINAAIVRINDREALLRETCRIAVEHGKFDMAWIGTVDHANQHIEPVAWEGFSTEAAHDLTWDRLNRPGVTLAEVMRTRKVAVRNNLDTEMRAGALREEAMTKGYRSTVCIPFMVDDVVVAAIILFAAGQNYFDDEEVALLTELASDVSFALQSIEKQKKLEYLSYYDVLTGLANRTLFTERVAQYMRSAVAGGHKLAVGLLDLERFKNINDSLGQPAGDALLKQVAVWLTQNVGDKNLAARVGADHFAVVLPVVKAEGNVEHLVQKTLDAFLDHPFRLNESVFSIAVKAGVALFPEDGVDADTLFMNAEA
ncbi:MAG: phosphodiesterase, partial [Betaproteobacteria bacterium]|nr:phosphodiesterase [Betaproteobacteria bacterium]